MYFLLFTKQKYDWFVNTNCLGSNGFLRGPASFVLEPHYILPFIKNLMADGFSTSYRKISEDLQFTKEFGLGHNQREGIIADPKCIGIETLIAMAGSLHQFRFLQNWLFIEEMDVPAAPSNGPILSELAYELLSNSTIYPNSQVIWAKEMYCGESDAGSDSNLCYELFSVYRVNKNSVLTSVYLGTSTRNESNLLGILDTLPRIQIERQDFQNKFFRSGIVIQYPKEHTYIADLHKRGTESFLRRSHASLTLLKEDLNFRTKAIIVDSFGWQKNNTGIFDGGLMGLFQTQTIEFAMQSVLMRTDRLAICDYSAELVQVQARVIYRQPPLSSVSNIYILPFTDGVWLSTGALLILISMLIIIELGLVKAHEETIDSINPGDLITFITGAIFQQGFSISPSTVSARLTMLLLFTSSLFLFTSYSANIVALLQSPSTSIKTLADLVDSPLGVGIHNITYNVVFITESKHPVTQKLYKQKVLPKGDRGFLNIPTGMALVRKGMYAFQVDTGAAYDIISQTYTEAEKCGLAEVELYQLPMQAVPLIKGSPYRDIFTTRLRWQKEVGLVDRIAKIWVPQKPKCESSVGGFVSVGLTEAKPALKAFAVGAIISCVAFLFEHVIVRYRLNRLIKMKASIQPVVIRY